MTDDHKELLERLEVRYHCRCGICDGKPSINPDGPEAANAIRALQAELSTLRMVYEDEVFLRTLIDLTWGEACNDQSVPSSTIQTRLIERVRRVCPSPANTAGGGECDLPPEGWSCTRPKGHENPCAAVPKACRS